MSTPREIQTSNSAYTKDDITVDIVDDYQLQIDKKGRIVDHKVRSQVRTFRIRDNQLMLTYSISNKNNKHMDNVLYIVFEGMQSLLT